MMKSLLAKSFVASALAGLCTVAGSVAHAHEVAFDAHLDEDQVVSPTGSAATGHLHLSTDEHSGLFDVHEFDVEGIFVGDLSNAHGPNNTAFHVHLGDPGTNGPILIDLHWYVNAGFGTITPTATGFHVVMTGLLTAVQGLYDMTAATGLTPDDVFAEMEEGHTYVQVHTTAFPEGEIRGQLIPDTTVGVEPATWSTVKLQFAR